MTLPPCPVCASNAVRTILSAPSIPVLCNELHDTRKHALQAPRGHLQLAYCGRCSHLYNAAFDASLIDYTTTYDNSLHHSGRFQAFARSLAERLVDSYQLYNRAVIEIGAGQGDFLQMLCENGRNEGIGFDPSYVGDSTEKDSISIVRDLYSEKYAHYRADLVCCRHVLEHITNPRSFVGTIRRALNEQPEAVLYIEVPHGGYMLTHHAIWDLIYEHASYYTPASLNHLMMAAGFQILSIQDAFEGQYLSIEVQPSNQPFTLSQDEAEKSSLERVALGFSEHYERKVAEWQCRLIALKAEGKRVMIWGCGSKGIAFLNLFADVSDIEFAIDINPRKEGKYVTGAGQEIVRPSFLENTPADVIIVMNSLYINEIKDSVEAICDGVEWLLA